MPHVNERKINTFKVISLAAILLLAGVFAITHTVSADSKLQVGTSTLILGSGDNLFFGNISASSSATSSLLLLQNASSNMFRVDPSGNVITNGTITAGGFSGPYTGTISAPNVSSGYFGSNTGGGNYSFPANVGIGITNPSKKLDVWGASTNQFAASFGRSINVGEWTGIHIGYKEAGNDNYKQAGIIFERTNYNSHAPGKIHILNALGPASATLSDAKMTINEVGNVGIGTVSPAQTLDVNGQIRITRPAGGYYGIIDEDQGRMDFDTYGSNSHFAWWVAGVQKMTLDNAGRLGVGINSPVRMLDVAGSFRMQDTSFYQGEVTVPFPGDSNKQIINWTDGTSVLDRNTQYKVQVFIRGDTSTDAGATYLVRDNSNYTGDAVDWQARLVSRAGYGSNHVLLEVDNVNQQIKVWHSHPSSTYTLGYLITAYRTTNNNNSLSIFGADYGWVRDANKIYYNDGNVGIGNTNPAFVLDVTGSARFTNTVEVATPTSGAHAATKAYVDSISGGGIGTGTTGQTLRHNGTSWTANSLLYNNGTNVGVGTTAPGAYLDISPSSSVANTIFQAISPANGNYNTNDVAVIRQGPAAGAGVTGTVLKVESRNGDHNTYALLNVQNNVSGTPSSKFYVGGDGNVGIGTTSPGYKLTVNGPMTSTQYRAPDGASGVGFVDDGGNGIYVKDGGNVGIGTTNPGATLFVQKTNGIYGAPSATYATTLANATTAIGNNVSGTSLMIGLSDGNTMWLQAQNVDNSLKHISLNTQGGNVGISDLSPSYKLDVNGTAQFTNTVLVATPTADGHAATKAYVDSAAGGGVGTGTTGQTLRHNGTGWIANSALFNNGTNVGIGTTAPVATLDIAGRTIFRGGSYSTDNVLNYEYDSLFAADKKYTVTNEGFNGVASLFDARPETAQSCSTLPCSVTIDFGGIKHYWYALSLSYVWGTGYGGSSNFTIEKYYDADSTGGCDTWGTIDTATNFSGMRYVNNATLLGNYVCKIKFTFNDIVGSTNRIELGELAAYQFYYPNDGPMVKRLGDTMYGGLNFAGVNSDITTPGTENLALMPGGNVGIGITAPAQKLEVRGDGARIRLSTASSPTGYYLDIESNYNASDTINFYAASGDNFLKWIYNNDVLALQPTSGNVGIYDITPSYKLDVNGTGQFTNTVVVATPTAGTHAATKAYVDSAAGGGVGAGTTGQTLRHDGSAWVANSTLFNNGTNVGVGTTNPQFKIDTPIGSKIGSYSDASHNASIEFYNSTTANMNFQLTNASGGSYTFSGGNVGIGTTNPIFSNGGGLTIANSGAARFKLAYTSEGSGATDGFEFINAWGTAYIWNYENHPILFGTSNAERVRIDTAGNVGIGTTAPDNALTVKGANALVDVQSSADGQFIGMWARYNNHSTLGGKFLYSTGAATLSIENLFAGNNVNYSDIYFRNADTDGTMRTRMTVKGSSGNIGINDTSPSYKLDVNGTAQFTNTVLVATPTAASHAATKAYVDSAAGGGVGAGTTGQTLRHDGSAWVANSTLFNNGTNVGVGTAGPNSLLHVNLPNESSNPVIIGRNNTTYTDKPSLSLTVSGGNNYAYRALNFQTIKADIHNTAHGIISNGYLNWNTGVLKITNSAYQTAGGIYWSGDGTTKIVSATTYGGVNPGVESDIKEVAVFTQSGNVGINDTTPTFKLDVNGTGQFTNTVVVATPTAGTHAATKDYVDSAAGGGVGAGTTGQTLRHNGTAWVSNSILYNDGTNVGIGTTGPGSIFHVNGGTNGYGIFERNGKRLYINGNWSAQNNYAQVAPRGSDNMGLSLSSKDTSPEYLFISTAGNVGIGTTAPGAKLEVGFTTWSNLNYPLMIRSGVRSYNHITYDTAVITQDDVTTLRLVENNVGTNQELGISIGDNEGVITSTEELDFYSGATPGGLIYSGSGGTRALRIQRDQDIEIMNGNLGIGTTAPAAKLSISGTLSTGAEAALLLDNAGSAAHAYRLQAGVSGVDHDDFAIFDTGTPNAVRLLIDENGNVGIGNNNPAYKLDVNGTGQFTNTVVVATPTATTHAATKAYVDSAVGGGVGAGTTGQTLRHDGSTWVSNSILYNNGTNVGIGTTAPTAKLDVLASAGYTAIKTNGFVEDQTGRGNLMSSYSWTIGTGGVGVFNQNGSTSENNREWGVGPHGNRAILWKATPDAVSGPDGGWDGSAFTIDDTKTYRFTVWIKKTGSVDGTTYLGCQGTSTNDLNDAPAGNPYFWAGDLPSLDKWYLLVGYIHGSGDASTSHYGGAYDGVTGQKVISFTDFKNKVGATTQNHRTYLYYSTAQDNNQYWWDPRVEEVNGREPSIEALLGLQKPATQNATAYFGGNVGIGTTNPNTSLSLGDNVNTLPDLTKLWIRGTGSSAYRSRISLGVDTNASVGAYFASTYYSSAEPGVEIGTRWDTDVTAVTIRRSGNVGIGTTVPTYRLDVNGTGRFANTVVVATPTAGTHATTKDYVDSVAGGGHTGSGTTNYMTKWTGTNALGNSIIFDNGTNVGIGTASPQAKVTLQDGEILFKESGSVHGMTSYFYQNTVGTMGRANTTTGGMHIWGVASSDAVGLTLRGVIGSATPSASTSATKFISSKQNGTSIGNLGNTDMAFQFLNNSTALISILGSSNVGIGTTAPNKTLEVAAAPGADGATAPTLRITDTSDIDYTLGAPIGGVEFYSNEQSGIAFPGVAASMRAVVETTAGHQVGLAFSTAYVDTSESERMRITSSGNVGIGITTPLSKLAVEGTGRFYSGATYAEIYSDASYAYFGQNANSSQATSLYGAGDVQINIDSNNNEATRFFSIRKDALAGGTELFRVQENGNVGINDVSPTYTLDVVGTGSFSNTVIVATPTAGTHAATKDYVDSAAGGGVGAGTTGQTLRHNGTGWVANSLLYNNGTNVGIGVVSPSETLQINGRTSFSNREITGAIIWPNVYDATGGRLVRNVIGNTDDLMAYAVERGYSVTASRGPDSGNLKCMFWPPGAGCSVPYWNNVSPANPVVITISSLPNLAVQDMIIVPGGRNRMPIDYKVETYDIYNGNWVTRKDVTSETAPYIKYISLGSQEGTQQIRLTISDAGDADADQILAIQNIVVTSRYQSGRFTGYGVSAAGDYMFGNLGIGTTTRSSALYVDGAGQFTNTVVVATPTATSHAATKAYVDSVAGGGHTGSGTTNYMTKWTGPNALGNSIIFDNGTNVGIGLTNPNDKLTISGASGIRIQNSTYDANLVFGSNDSWKSGIRVFDNGDAEMRIWHANNLGQIILATGYNGDESAVMPTDGLFIDQNKVGIGYASPAGSTGKLVVNGNVGIGTTAPSARLDVRGTDYQTGHLYVGDGIFSNPGNWDQTINLESSAHARILIEETSTGGQVALWAHTGGNAKVGTISATNFGIITQGAERMTFDLSGNVGINDTTPTYKLDVNGTGQFTNTVVVATPTAGTHAATKDYVDSAAGGGVGAGTTGQTLRHNGTAWVANSLLYNNGTNVGVGTTNPLNDVHIYGGASGGTPYESGGGLIIERNGRTSMQFLSPNTSDQYIFFGDPQASNKAWVGYDHAVDQLLLKTGGTTYMDGNIGIGTTAPRTKLEVAGDLINTGTIIARSVRAARPEVEIAQGCSVAVSGGTLYNGGPTWRNTGSYWRITSPGQSITLTCGGWWHTGLSFAGNNRYNIAGSKMPAGFTVERSVDGGVNWLPVSVVTGNTEDYYNVTFGDATMIRVTVNSFQGSDTTAEISAFQVYMMYPHAAPTPFGYTGTGSVVQMGSNVGLNDNTPSYRLDVNGTAQFTNTVLVATPTADGHAATKAYVDSAAGGGVGAGTTGQTLRHNGTAWVANSVLYNNGTNVGIGTTAPNTLFEVMTGTAADGSQIRVNSSGQALEIVDRYLSSDFSAKIWANWPGNGQLHFGVNASAGAPSTVVPTLTIRNTSGAGTVGNVGIGTSAPTAQLDVRMANTHTTGAYTGGGNLLLYNTQNNADELGAFLTFGSQYNDGSQQFTTRAGIKGGTDTAGNSADGYLAFYTANGSANNNLERVRIDRNGNLGIGTINPTYNLDVVGTARFASGNNSYAFFGPNTSWGGKLYVGATTDKYGSDTAQVISTSGNLHLDPGTSDHIYINYYNTAANVGIAVSPSYKLDVNGPSRVNNTLIVGTPTSGTHAATKDYVDSASSGATMARYVASTATSYDGGRTGYTNVNSVCNAAYAGSHVCTTEEILYTINSGSSASIPYSSSLWISNGPPGFTVNANDCMGWTSSASTSYSAIWIKLGSGDGFGALDKCDTSRKFACCAAQ